MGQFVILGLAVMATISTLIKVAPPVLAIIGLRPPSALYRQSTNIHIQASQVGQNNF